ncbi:ATP-binding protein [Salinactinospora qingdaonensis]|uniref:Histidine kinase/HSP90-like ATPase domain-containing protein n=1 Tax=Salinactinospora qingdaonensis TaxID=702744 RepID=A0ABP7FRS9_9ACTN
MSIVPYISTGPVTVRRGELTPRVYPGDLAQTSRVRAELRSDLARLRSTQDDPIGLPDDLVDTVVLCASEAFANAVEHTRSGEPGGEVLRVLSAPTPQRLRLVIVDDGAAEPYPDSPGESTAEHTAAQDEGDYAERGRGLLLIDTLAAAWGSHPLVAFPFCAGLGTVVWAEFALPTPQEATR